MPKGLKMMNILIDFWRKEHEKRGYLEFSGPQLNNSDLWKTSGHWEHYKEDMFVLTSSPLQYAPEDDNNFIAFTHPVDGKCGPLQRSVKSPCL